MAPLPWATESLGLFLAAALHGVVESKILVPTSRNHKTYLMPGALEATAPISLGDDGCFSRLLETCTRKESLSDGFGGNVDNAGLSLAWHYGSFHHQLPTPRNLRTDIKSSLPKRLDCW